jgi:hypothetical protein
MNKNISDSTKQESGDTPANQPQNLEGIYMAIFT